MVFCIFVGLAFLFGNSIHALRIAAFASKGDRDLSQACGGCRNRFHPRRRPCVVARPGTNAHPDANSHANPVILADADSDANFPQLGYLGGANPEESRPPFPWAPCKSRDK